MIKFLMTIFYCELDINLKSIMRNKTYLNVIVLILLIEKHVFGEFFEL